MALVTDAFGSQGGIAKFNRDLLTALSSCESVAEVVAFPRAIEDRSILSDGLGAHAANSRSDGARTSRALSRLVFRTEAAGSKLRYTAAVISALVRRPRYDVIICGHLNLLPLAVVAQRICRAPIFQVLHGIEAWEAPRSRWIRASLGNIGILLSVSNFTHQRFLSWSRLHNIPTHFVGNCVDLSRFTPGPKNSILPERYAITQRRILMTLGRMSASERYKGIDQVLESMPALLQKIPNLAYMVCGDGNDRPRLVEKARRLGLSVLDLPSATSNSYPRGFGPSGIEPKEQTFSPPLSTSSAPHVVFTGKVREVEKADHFRFADAFVMAGWGEGFGIVFLEALACGIPVVASILDGSREAVLNGAIGKIVNPKNPSGLQSGIIEALNKPKLVPDELSTFSFERFERRIHESILRHVSQGKLATVAPSSNLAVGRY